MYHNTHDGTIELHDDVEIESALLSHGEGEPRKLTVVYVLRDDKVLHPTDLPRLHSTNGVNHRYVQLPVVNERDEAPIMSEENVDLDSTEGAEEEIAPQSGKVFKLPAKKNVKREAE
jgi:hypothetical protein